MSGPVPKEQAQRTRAEALKIWRFDLIRAERVRRGLSQRQFAAELREAQATVATWELGRRVPRLEHFKRMCQVLKMDPGLLLGLEERPLPPLEFEVRYRLVGGVNGEVAQVEGVAQPIESS